VRAGWIAVIATIASVPSAHADAAPGPYEEAIQLYHDNDFLHAAAKFEQAYRVTHDPGLLFDIAQAYRLGRACAQAARYYHQFLTVVPAPPNRSQLDKYVADMDACAKAEAAARPEPQVLHETKVVHDTTVVTRVVRVADHRASVVLAAVGVVGLGVGAYFTYDVHHVEQEYGALCAGSCVWPTVASKAAALDTRGQRAEIGEAAAYGIGGAAMLVAAALLVLRPGDAEQVTPVPGGATVGASWQF
jgi:hypothetical protein